jgi:predicted RNase H-like nuclease
VLELVPDVQVIAVDIPIGLLDTGPRRADILARAKLPGRASTVFNAPPRACLKDVDNYPGANATSLRVLGKGLSKQSFALLTKIHDVDEFWSVAPCPVFEVHPELSFAKINHGNALASKKTWAGMTQRRDALASVGIVLDRVDTDAANRATTDDMLDAGVCAWTAREILAGRAISLPDPAEVDAAGRLAAIWV